jgi:hypothetical protein
LNVRSQSRPNIVVDEISPSSSSSERQGARDSATVRS